MAEKRQNPDPKWGQFARVCKIGGYEINCIRPKYGNSVTKYDSVRVNGLICLKESAMLVATLTNKYLSAMLTVNG